MKKELLKSIAETGYNVGFGAKKHFATYDIVEKAPGIISFSSMAFGIYALVIEDLSNEFISATFIVLGLVGLYISFYDSQKHSYELSAKKLTQLYNQLGLLYRRVKGSEDANFAPFENELMELQKQYYECCHSKQILFSDWYAHYKFFWQHQIEWVDEEKKFGLLRDKIPLSFYISIVVAALIFAFAKCYQPSI